MESTSNSSGQYDNTAGKSNANSSSNTGKPGSVGSQGNTGSGMNMGSLTDMVNDLHIPETLKKYTNSATNAIKGMSTTQKVIGGALLVLGATYLTRGSRGGWMKKAAGLASMAKMAKNKNKSGR